MSSGLTLLGRELSGVAMRRRTHLLRLIYGGVVYGLGYLYYLQEVGGDRDLLELLGRGRTLYQFVIRAQITGALLLIPLLMSGAIAGERERGTLDVLLSSRPGASGVLSQKFWGRMIPALVFLLLPTPLLALAYGLGGLDATDLALGAVWVLVAGACIGSFCLAISSASTTTLGATVMSFLLGAAIWGTLSLPLDILESDQHGRSEAQLGGVLILALFTLLNLVLARVFLGLPVPAGERHPLRVMLSRFTSRAARVSGLAAFLREREGARAEPGDDPVAWREVHRRWWGDGRRRLLSGLAGILAMLVLVGISVWSASDEVERAAHLDRVLLLLFGLSAVCTVVVAIDLLARERERGTLDVLMTTALPRGEIIAQKVLVLRRMSGLFVPPLMTALGARIVLGGLGIRHLALGTLVLHANLFAIAWLSFYLGTRRVVRVRASAFAIVAIAASWGLPALLEVIWPGAAGIWATLSPVVLLHVSFTESAIPWPSALLQVGVLTLVGIGVRRHCLRNADRVLSV